MLTEKEQTRISEKISVLEHIGEHAGGSGHTAYTHASIDKTEVLEKNENSKDILCEYTVFIETEFTYCPDNPPEETTYSIKFRLTENTIEVLEEKQIVSSNFNWDIHDEDIPEH